MAFPIGSRDEPMDDLASAEDSPTAALALAGGRMTGAATVHDERDVLSKLDSAG